MSNSRGSVSQPIDIRSNQKAKNSRSAPAWATQLHKVSSHKDIQSAPPADGKLESYTSKSFYSQSVSFFVGSFESEQREKRTKLVELQSKSLEKEKILTLSEEDNLSKKNIESSESSSFSM